MPISGITDLEQRRRGLNNANQRPTLRDLSEYGSDEDNTIVCFHGTCGLLNEPHGMGNQGENISTYFGRGRLGEGFYITFNPNEALSYACLSANKANQINIIPIIYEIHIRNANQFIRGGTNPQYEYNHVPRDQNANDGINFVSGPDGTINYV